MTQTATDRAIDLIMELIDHACTTASGLGFDQKEDVQIEKTLDAELANIRRRLEEALTAAPSPDTASPHQTPAAI